MYLYDCNLVVVTEPKTITFNLTNRIDNSLNHETEYIIEQNEVLAEHTIKMRLLGYYFKFKNGSNILEHGNYKTNDPLSFFLVCHEY